MSLMALEIPKTTIFYDLFKSTVNANDLYQITSCFISELTGQQFRNRIQISCRFMGVIWEETSVQQNVQGYSDLCAVLFHKFIHLFKKAINLKTFCKYIDCLYACLYCHILKSHFDTFNRSQFLVFHYGG